MAEHFEDEGVSATTSTSQLLLLLFRIRCRAVNLAVSRLFLLLLPTAAHDFVVAGCDTAPSHLPCYVR